MQGTDNWYPTAGDQQDTKNGIFALVRLVSKPLRIFQFLVVLVIFVLAIYTISSGHPKVSSVICLLLLILSGVYVFILAIDVISQFSGGELHAIPMILFTFLGALLFGIAVALLIPVYSATAFWYILTTLILCFIMCIFFLIEIAMVLVFWKRKYLYCKECCATNRTKMLRGDSCHPLCSETAKYDLMTSVSNLKVASGDEEGTPDHSLRQVKYGHRRQYVDCPTSARTASVVDIAEVQTEHHPTTNIESQTQRELKEIPVQTVSRCELCNRQMQFFPSSDATQPATQQVPCAPCPALVQLIRGVPCCPGCRCVAGIVQMSQQGQQTQRQDQQEQPTKEQLQWVQPMDKKSYGVLSSSKSEPGNTKLTAMPGTITKLTVASYCVPPSKKTNTSSQTVGSDYVKTAKKTIEPTESKKPRVSISRRERQDIPKNQKEDLIPEREKAKAPSTVKKDPRRSVLKRQSETYAEKEIDSSKKQLPDRRTSAQAPREKSSSLVPEDISTNSFQQAPTSLDTQKISPPAQVAKIITRLQEIEGTKTDEQPKKDLLTSEMKEDLETTETEKEQSATTELDKTDTVKPFKKSVHIPSTEDQLVSIAHIDAISSFTSGESRISRSPEVSKESSYVSKESTETKEDSDASKEAIDISASNDKPKLDDLEKVDETKVERSMETSSAFQPQMGTQTKSNRNKKTHVLRKNNKVEPIEISHTEMDVQTIKPETPDENSSPSTSKPQSERLFTGEKRVSVEEKTVNICPSCQRQQLPSSSSPLRYYSVHRDKRGRLYCDFCATANCVQVLYKNNDHKRLKCAGCGNFIRDLRNNSDNCPKCGQTQARVQSAPPK